MTRASRRVFDAVRELTIGDVPPTVREIAEALGMHLSQVHSHLTALRADGLVAWTPAARRTLHIVADTRAYTITALTRLEAPELQRLITNASAALARKRPATRTQELPV